jgi:hypothetical protein
MPQGHQDSKLHLAPATMIELTACQANNATRISRQPDSFQLQPPWHNLHPVKPKMPQAHQDSQLHSSSRHHGRTHILSRQGCQKEIKTVSFIPAPATMKELTCYQATHAASTARLSALIQLQSPLWDALPTGTPEICGTLKLSALFHLQQLYKSLLPFKSGMPSLSAIFPATQILSVWTGHAALYEHYIAWAIFEQLTTCRSMAYHHIRNINAYYPWRLMSLLTISKWSGQLSAIIVVTQHNGSIASPSYVETMLQFSSASQHKYPLKAMLMTIFVIFSCKW